MPNKQTITLLIVSLFMTGCLFESKSPKHASLQPSLEKLKRTAKLDIGAKAKLSISSEVKSGENFVVRMLVERKSASENYNYQLNLPEGLKLVKGESSGSLVFNENKAELNFEIYHESYANQRIGALLVSSSGGKQRFSISTLNYFVDKKKYDALYERAQDYIEEHPEALKAQSKVSDAHTSH